MNKNHKLNKVLFNVVFHEGKISYSPNFIIKFKKNPNGKRIGISVSKKNFKKSTLRNKIKRQVRSILNQVLPQIQNFDLIIIIKKKYNITMYKELEKELITLLKKNKILQI
ncbi:MAG: ribonuclease P protein component [Mycoplasmoidaceae bacterium]